MVNAVINTEIDFQEQLRDLQDKLDAIPDLMFEVDIDGRILSYHSPRTDLLYIPPEFFLGKLCSEVLPPYVADICAHAIAEAFETGFSLGKQYHLELAQGLRWFELSVSKRNTPENAASRFILLARDITDRKHLEHALLKSEEQLHSVFKTMSEGIAVQDSRGQMIDVNDAAVKILGLTREQFLGRATADPRWKTIYEDGTPFPSDEYPTMVTLKTGKPVLGQIMGVYTPDDQLRWISINSKVIGSEPSPELRKVLTTFVDITERKHAELALAKSSRALKVLSDFNELLVRADTETELLYAACQLLVERGNYLSAWVVFDFKQGKGEAQTVAQYGFDEALLLNGHVRWSDIGHGPDPVLVAVMSSEVVIRNNCLGHQSDHAIWRQFHSQDHFGSVIAIPLIYQQNKLGALAICAHDNSFGPEEMGLLHKLADNLSYGIQAIRVRNERHNFALAQEAIRQRAIDAETNLVKISELTLRRLGHDLHDDLGQLLSGASMLADVIYHRLLENVPEQAEAMLELRDLLSRSMRKVRTISHGLYPVEFERVGLVTLLNGLARQVELISAIKVNFTHSRNHFSLLPEQSLHLYRIAQEAMNNSVRHSRATEISIGLELNAGNLTMTITDNGIGMENQDENSKGIGLLGIHSRAVVLNAELSIANAEPQGLCIKVTMPVSGG